MVIPVCDLEIGLQDDHAPPGVKANSVLRCSASRDPAPNNPSRTGTQFLSARKLGIYHIGRRIPV
jgi:hypothetical protein